MNRRFALSLTVGVVLAGSLVFPIGGTNAQPQPPQGETTQPENHRTASPTPTFTATPRTATPTATATATPTATATATPTGELCRYDVFLVSIMTGNPYTLARNISVQAFGGGMAGPIVGPYALTPPTSSHGPADMPERLLQGGNTFVTTAVHKGDNVTPAVTVAVTGIAGAVPFTTTLLCPEAGSNGRNVTQSFIFANMDRITITIRIVVDP